MFHFTRLRGWFPCSLLLLLYNSEMPWVLLGNSRRLWDDQSKIDFSSLEFWCSFEFCCFSDLDSVWVICRPAGWEGLLQWFGGRPWNERIRCPDLACSHRQRPMADSCVSQQPRVHSGWTRAFRDFWEDCSSIWTVLFLSHEGRGRLGYARLKPNMAFKLITGLLSHNVGWFLFSHSLSLCLRMRQHVLRSVEILPWVQWLSCWGNWDRVLNSAVLWVLWLVWKSVPSSRNLCLGLVISLWRLLEFRDAEPQWCSVTLNSGPFSGCWECKFHLCAGKRGPMASVRCSFTCMAMCAPPPWGALCQGILSLSGVGWGSGAVSRGNHSTRMRLTL